MGASNSVMRGINEAAVSAWLEENAASAHAPFTFEFITGGHSNLTYRVICGDGTELVLRRPPLGAVLATAHDMNREYRAITAFGPTRVPVPETLAMCEDTSVNDAPFYVMNFVDGVVLHDDALAAQYIAPELRMTLSNDVMDVLAALHGASAEEIGLGDLGRPADYVSRQLKRWNRQWESSKTRELPAMDELYAALVAHTPTQLYSSVVHGDYRLGNMLVSPETGKIVAVLDWELCTQGDPLADLGYLMNNWLLPGEENVRGATAFPTLAGGFATRTHLLERYASTTGYSVDNIGYYQAFQFWRLAAIVEGVLSRYVQGVMGDATEFDTESYATQVESLVEAATDLAKEF